VRKVIARRLTESKQTVPHIYLTVDIQLDALLKLRGELNKGLESRGVKLSVNDMLVKALAGALMDGLRAVATPKEVIERAKVWAPYRSIASIYLWQAIKLKLRSEDINKHRPQSS